MTTMPRGVRVQLPLCAFVKPSTTHTAAGVAADGDAASAAAAAAAETVPKDVCVSAVALGVVRVNLSAAACEALGELTAIVGDLAADVAALSDSVSSAADARSVASGDLSSVASPRATVHGFSVDDSTPYASLPSLSLLHSSAAPLHFSSAAPLHFSGLYLPSVSLTTALLCLLMCSLADVAVTDAQASQHFLVNQTEFTMAVTFARFSALEDASVSWVVAPGVRYPLVRQSPMPASASDSPDTALRSDRQSVGRGGGGGGSCAVATVDGDSDGDCDRDAAGHDGAADAVESVGFQGVADVTVDALLRDAEAAATASGDAPCNPSDIAVVAPVTVAAPIDTDGADGTAESGVCEEEEEEGYGLRVDVAIHGFRVLQDLAVDTVGSRLLRLLPVPEPGATPVGPASPVLLELCVELVGGSKVRRSVAVVPLVAA